MKTFPVLSWPAALLVALGAFAPLPGLARDSDVGTYRCTVNGNTNFCHAASGESGATRVEKQLVPGSYARYLMYRGESLQRAVRIAGSVGESPVERTVRVTPRSRTSYERYQRWLGDSSVTDATYETLAEQWVDPASVR